MNNSFMTNTVTRAQTFTLSLTAQIGVFLFLSALVIWTVLFSSYAPVHDSVHAIRHALYIVSCH